MADYISKDNIPAQNEVYIAPLLKSSLGGDVMLIRTISYGEESGLEIQKTFRDLFFDDIRKMGVVSISKVELVIQLSSASQSVIAGIVNADVELDYGDLFGMVGCVTFGANQMNLNKMETIELHMPIDVAHQINPVSSSQKQGRFYLSVTGKPNIALRVTIKYVGMHIIHGTLKA